MLYILDTDHMTLWQHGHPLVLAALERTPLTDRAVTLISLTEQIQGWLAAMSRAQGELQVANSLQRLYDTIRFYNLLQVIAYDAAAVSEFERLRSAKVRIGTQDLRIASIALSRNAVIVTRNLRDFNKVPGLQVVDWSAPTELL
jgi:tRNA(fMet)-specific endonuclease VapC